MARTETLELLASVVDRLEPVASMSPGTPLRAGDWNRIVEAVRDLARLVASRERTTDEFLAEDYARVDHGHVNQVGMTWFDPPTRALIERGLQGALEDKTALKAARDEVERLRRLVEDQQRALNDAKGDLDGLRDQDAARRRDLSRVELRVEGLRDVERSVATFDGRLETIASNVGAALQFRDRLVGPDGAPIDVGGLQQRIGSLETLRENLRTADGEVVRIRELESALARLEQNGLNRADFDATLADRLRDADLLDRAGIVEAVVPAVTAGLNDRFAALETGADRLRTELAGARSTLGTHEASLATVQGRLSGAETQLGTLGGLRTQVEDQQGRLIAAESALQSNQAALGDVAALRTRLQSVEGRVETFSGLASNVGRLEERIAGHETRLSSLDPVVGRVTALDQRLGSVEGVLSPLQQAVATTSALARDLERLSGRVTANEAELDNLAGMTDRVESLRANLEALDARQVQTDQRLADLGGRLSIVDDLRPRLTALEQSNAEMRNSLNQLGTGLRTVTGNLDSLRSSVETLTANTRDLGDLRATVARMDSRVGAIERSSTPSPTQPNNPVLNQPTNPVISQPGNPVFNQPTNPVVVQPTGGVGGRPVVGGANRPGTAVKRVRRSRRPNG